MTANPASIGGIYVVTCGNECSTIEDFIHLANTTDSRRTNVIEASCVLGKNFFKCSEKRIADVCAIILKNKKNQSKTLIKFQHHYYSKNLTKIDREREISDDESSMDNDTDSHINPSNRISEQMPRIIKRKSKTGKITSVQKQLRKKVLKQLTLPGNANIDEYYNQTLDTATYYSNLTIRDMPSVLEGPARRCHSNIDPTINENVDIMKGINTSTYYLACIASASETHREDSDLPSMNVVYFNVDSSKSKAIAKKWTIIPNKAKLQECVAKASLENLNLLHQPSCCQYLDLKNCIVTTDFLNEHNITFYTVDQYPGDIVYVDCGVYHQVVNINMNFAEAINYGSDKWQLLNQVSNTCECHVLKNSGNEELQLDKENFSSNTGLATTMSGDNEIILLRRAEIQHILTNDKRVVTVKGCNKRPSHKCSMCDFESRRKDVYDEHMKKQHAINTFRCNDCNRIYKASKSLYSHICQYRENQEKKRFNCNICKTRFVSRSLHENTGTHKRKLELCNTVEVVDDIGDLVKCKRCGKSKRMRDLEQHEKKCKGHQHQCSACGSRFSTKQAYQRHQNKCQAASDNIKN